MQNEIQTDTLLDHEAPPLGSAYFPKNAPRETDYYDDEIYDEDVAPAQESEPKNPFSIARLAGGVMLLVLIGSSSAFAWRAYGNTLEGLLSFTSSAAAPAVVAEPTVPLKEFQAFQLQAAGQLQSTTKLLTDEQSLTKRLSDQVAALNAQVTDLNAKIDSLEHPAGPVHAARPVPNSPLAAVAKKKPAAKPKAVASTGGKPLSPPLQLTH